MIPSAHITLTAYRVRISYKENVKTLLKLPIIYGKIRTSHMNLMNHSLNLIILHIIYKSQLTDEVMEYSKIQFKIIVNIILIGMISD